MCTARSRGGGAWMRIDKRAKISRSKVTRRARGEELQVRGWRGGGRVKWVNILW